MAIPRPLPRAPDGAAYGLAQRFGSLYTWGRPPIPAMAADTLAAVVDHHAVRSALVLGSCCPSVLAALGFGDPERVIRMVDMESRWWEGYNSGLDEGSPRARAAFPTYDPWLPGKKILALTDWRYGPTLGEMLFIDLPGESDLVRKDLSNVVRRVRPRLVVMGFLERYQGPQDLEEYLRQDRAWSLDEERHFVRNHETGERLTYRLVVAVKTLDADDIAAAEERKARSKAVAG